MKKGFSSKKYARGLLEQAKEPKNFEEVAKAAELVIKLFSENPQILKILSNPIIPLGERQALIDKISPSLSLPLTLQKFLKALLGENALKGLKMIYDNYLKLMDEHLGRARAEVISARELTSKELEEIKGSLSRFIGKDVLINTKVDPEILGGVISKIGSTIIDGSIKTRLKVIAEELSG